MENGSLEETLERMVNEEKMLHEEGASPFSPRNLLSLYIRPREFFLGEIGYGQPKFYLIALWVYGVSQSIDRFSDSIERADMGSPRAGWDTMGPMITDSWATFWPMVLVFGALGMAFLWFIGGWWYKMRLRFAGVASPNAKQARLVYVYSSLVAAIPAVLLAVVQTAFFGNFLEAWNSEELYSTVLAVFPFWSMVTSYVGARAVFGASRWRAALWFGILPAVVVLVAMGLLAAFLY